MNCATTKAILLAVFTFVTRGLVFDVSVKTNIERNAGIFNDSPKTIKVFTLVTRSSKN